MDFRLFESKDIQLYMDWHNQKEIWEVDGDDGPFEIRTVENFQERWDKIVGGRCGSWFICIDGREIGYVGFI